MHMKFTHSMHQFINKLLLVVAFKVSRPENLSCWRSGGSITTECSQRGGRWARGYTSQWRVESRDIIIGLHRLLSG